MRMLATAVCCLNTYCVQGTLPTTLHTASVLTTTEGYSYCPNNIFLTECKGCQSYDLGVAGDLDLVRLQFHP